MINFIRFGGRWRTLGQYFSQSLFRLNFFFCGYDLKKAVGMASQKPITWGKLFNLILVIIIDFLMFFFNYLILYFWNLVMRDNGNLHPVRTCYWLRNNMHKCLLLSNWVIGSSWKILDIESKNIMKLNFVFRLLFLNFNIEQ